MTDRMVQYYMKQAHTASLMSRCNRAKVGVVIVNNETIISDSWNGTLRGEDNGCECKETGRTLPNVVHAEANAIAKAARNGHSTQGASLFCTLAPCHTCALLIIQAGIKEVFFLENYRDSKGIDFLSRNGVTVYQTIYK